MLKQPVGPLEDCHATGRDVLIDLALHCLPALGPEPSLIRRHRKNGSKLDGAVVLFDDFYLRAGLVQM